MTLDKETLRTEAIRHRDRIDLRTEDTEVARDLFFEKINPQQGQVVAAFWPKGREFNPWPVIERLLKESVTCALPIVKKDTRVLSFALWNESIELEKGPYGIQQPVQNEKTQWLEPDIVIVPFLAFDRRGGRLGYGGGYYDATLKELRAKKSVTAVGLGYAQQAVLFNLPAEEHDERLDWVITPQAAHCFIAD